MFIFDALQDDVKCEAQLVCGQLSEHFVLCSSIGEEDSVIYNAVSAKIPFVLLLSNFLI